MFFSAASALVNPAAARIGTFTISLINAIGMAVLGTGIAHLALVAITGKRFALARLWPIFSLSASVVLVLAWIPAAIFITEPWRWWLIGTGFVRGLGLTKARGHHGCPGDLRLPGDDDQRRAINHRRMRKNN